MPFLIFALPRSRTTWLSHWLSYGGRLVGHDTAIECASVRDFLAQFWSGKLRGSVETGAMMGGRLIRHAMPSAKFVVIRRPVGEVEASLQRFGVIGVREELERRDAMLDDLERGCGAASVSFDNLRDRGCCEALFQYCLGVPFDADWWQAINRRNIQVDVGAELELVGRNAKQIAVLKSEVADLTSRLGGGNPPPCFEWIGEESFARFIADAMPLIEAHYKEVGSHNRAGPPMEVDVQTLMQMQAMGTLKVITARINERLVGYCMWTLVRDVERGGVLIADQGPWYVDPEAPRNLRLGSRLLTVSYDTLRTIGVRGGQMHHNLVGRGARAGVLFRRMGAQITQHRYEFWLGD